MIPQQRGFGRGGSHFSFANHTRKKTNESDQLDHGAENGTRTWRVTAGINDYFRKSGSHKFGPCPNRIAGKHKDLGDLDRTWSRWQDKEEEEDDLDFSSPPLWKKGGSPVHDDESPDAPVHDEESTGSLPVLLAGHVHRHGNHMFPISRSEVIASHRKEMIEMVKGLPEAAYELSLKDMVELPKLPKAGESTPEREVGLSKRATGSDNKDQKNNNKKKKSKAKREGNRRKQALRSDSMESGALLLKMFFPFSLGGKRRSRRRRSPSPVGSKVSPKPILPPYGDNGNDEMSRSSSGDSTAAVRRSSSRRIMSGCYSFIKRGRARGQ